VVLLVLAGIWAVVLLAPLVRRRANATLGDSIGSFRRHLSVLERAAPATVPPANRLRVPSAQALARAVRRRKVQTRRHHAQRRRRDVLFALVAGVAGSLVLALLSGLRVMMWVQVVMDLLFMSYVVLLVHVRNLAAEREMKLSFASSRAAAAAERGRGGGGSLRGPSRPTAGQLAGG